MTPALASPATEATQETLADCPTEPAENPTEFSALGWWGILKRTVRLTLHHRAPATGAAAAFYGLLAFLPAIAAFGSAYGWLAGADALQKQLDDFADLVPVSVLQIVRGEAVRFAHGPPARLGLQAVLFTAISLVSATSGVRALMGGLNIAYGVEERRHWVRRRILASGFAAGLLLALGGDVALVVRSTDYLARETGVLWPTLRLIGRWTSLFLLSAAALALLYRYGPDRRRARWRWVTPGSAIAAIVGLLTSAGASIYLAQFANYERTYGGLGSVLALAIWLWASMIVVLAGAELNCAMESATSAVTDVSGRAAKPAPDVPAKAA